VSGPPDREAAPAGPGGPEARRRPALLVELLVLTVCFAAFTFLHAATGQAAGTAAANARRVQSVEQALHVDVTLAANTWLAAHPLLTTASVYLYRSYYLVVVGVLVWVVVRHPQAYRRVRRTLVAMFVLVLPVYWAFPLSPPRFALAGTVDLVAEHDPLGSHGPDAGHQGQTAMPSMHVALSAWCAWAVWSTLRATHPRLALLAWLFPLAMTAVVFGTANHYALDVAGSAVLLVASIAAADLWGRPVGRRPDVSAAASPTPAPHPGTLPRP
jgi:hypothetical protein